MSTLSQIILRSSTCVRPQPKPVMHCLKSPHPRWWIDSIPDWRDCELVKLIGRAYPKMSITTRYKTGSMLYTQLDARFHLLSATYVSRGVLQLTCSDWIG